MGDVCLAPPPGLLRVLWSVSGGEPEGLRLLRCCSCRALAPLTLSWCISARWGSCRAGGGGLGALTPRHQPLRMCNSLEPSWKQLLPTLPPLPPLLPSAADEPAAAVLPQLSRLPTAMQHPERQSSCGCTRMGRKGKDIARWRSDCWHSCWRRVPTCWRLLPST